MEQKKDKGHGKPAPTRRCCPKCGSRSIYLDSDQYGWFQHCLQCGYQGKPASHYDK